MGLFIFEDFVGGIRANSSRYESYRRTSDFIYLLQEYELLKDFLTENQFFYHQGVVKAESEIKLYFINKKEIIIARYDSDFRVNIERFGNEIEKIEFKNLHLYRQLGDLTLTFKGGNSLSFSCERDSNDKTQQQFYKAIFAIYEYYSNEI